MKKSTSFSDTRLLEMILLGEIVIEDLFERDPTVYHRGNKRLPYICEGKRNPRYFYKIHDFYDLQGIRHFRSVSRNKLVWMYWHRQLVPPAHIVHHKDEDRFNDAINNLELKSDEDHKAYHYGNQQYDIPD